MTKLNIYKRYIESSNSWKTVPQLMAEYIQKIYREGNVGTGKTFLAGAEYIQKLYREDGKNE